MLICWRIPSLLWRSVRDSIFLRQHFGGTNYHLMCHIRCLISTCLYQCCDCWEDKYLDQAYFVIFLCFQIRTRVLVALLACPIRRRISFSLPPFLSIITPRQFTPSTFSNVPSSRVMDVLVVSDKTAGEEPLTVYVHK